MVTARLTSSLLRGVPVAAAIALAGMRTMSSSRRPPSTPPTSTMLNPNARNTVPAAEQKEAGSLSEVLLYSSDSCAQAGS